MWSVMYWNCTRTSDHAPRILVVRLGAMGDIVQTLPAVADLRSAMPDARIDWAVETRWKPLLDGNPSIDEAIPISLGLWRNSKSRLRSWNEARGLVRSLRARGYDLALDFQGLVKSALLAKLSDAGCVAGFEPSLQREPLAGLVYSRRAGSSSRHVVDRYRDLAAFVVGAPSANPATFPLPEGTLDASLPERFVLASPRAGWASKQWPAAHYSELAATIWHSRNIPLVVDCAPGDERHVEAIDAAAPPGAVIPHASTIEGLIGATRAAEAVVGVDSGPLHLASAAGKPGVAIFGPTDPDRNGPYGSGIVVVRDPIAETTYKRGRDPSRSMHACGPAMVYDSLRPFLG